MEHCDAGMKKNDCMNSLHLHLSHQNTIVSLGPLPFPISPYRPKSKVVGCPHGRVDCRAEAEEKHGVSNPECSDLLGEDSRISLPR
jgi:hypothetical protein